MDNNLLTYLWLVQPTLNLPATGASHALLFRFLPIDGCLTVHSFVAMLQQYQPHLYLVTHLQHTPPARP
jgi:hypothetical protein